MRRNDKANHTFSAVPKATIPRAKFDRSHGYKTTFNPGVLVPFYVDEALPGDTFTLNASAFARLSTPFTPLMDNMHLDIFFFAVPNRLVWNNWQKFCGEQEDPGDSTDYRIPIVTTNGPIPNQTLQDYFGLPTGTANVACNALPFRAYNLIWNEWFRDQNLQPSAIVNKTDGPDSETIYGLLKRGKRHDYFTSCLPWPQKGSAVDLPLGESAPVVIGGSGYPQFSAGGVSSTGFRIAATQGLNSPITLDEAEASGDLRWGTTALITDLSDATAASINSLRQAFQVQKLLERDARGGTRYTEIIRSHFGVISPDARLQRPEYLGGGTIPVTFNPVTQTSATNSTDDTPQGNLAAFAVAGGHGIGFTKSFTEHTILIGLISARADLNYQQGMNRMWSRQTRWDFYWPAFAHLGEQPVYNREIYHQGTDTDAQVFGYQERWAEYRYKPSLITGKFRSSDPQSLDIWHLAQDFSALPTLSATFIEENPPIDRILAVPSEPAFLLDAWFKVSCARPMPLYSVPGYIDHF